MRTVDPVKHEFRRAEILAAAGRCFARNGFHGATVAQICTEAGISSGHLYHYFANKEAIISSMCTGVGYATARATEISGNPDPVAALIGEVERLVAQDNQTSAGVWLEILAEGCRSTSIAGILEASSAQLCGILADFLRRGQAGGQIDGGLDPDMAATMLLGIIDGFKAMSVRAPGLNDAARSKMLDQLMRRYLSPSLQQSALSAAH